MLPIRDFNSFYATSIPYFNSIYGDFGGDIQRWFEITAHKRTGLR